jgi:hypothetical protein
MSLHKNHVSLKIGMNKTSVSTSTSTVIDQLWTPGWSYVIHEHIYREKHVKHRYYYCFNCGSEDRYASSFAYDNEPLSCFPCARLNTRFYEA